MRIAMCPVCGRHVDKLVDGMCEECFRREHPLVSLKVKQLEIEVCRSCGSLRFRKGKWYSDVKELEREIAREASRLVRARDSISAVEAEFSRDLSLLFLKVTGKASPELSYEYTEEFVLKVSTIRTLCETCLGHVSKRKNTLVQIRVHGRRLTQPELRELSKRVEETISELATQDPGVVPVEMEEKPVGLDIYFSEYSAARKVVEALSRKIYVEVLETAKLVGVDDSGREKYRRTIRLLIPGFRTGDVIKFNENIFFVLNVTPRHVELLNLENYTLSSFRLSHNFTSRVTVLAHASELPEAIVVSSSGNFIQVMDLSSYKTLEVRLDSQASLKFLAGQERLRIYSAGEKIYLIPSQYILQGASRRRA